MEGVRGVQLQTIRALQFCTMIAVRRVIDGQGWAEIEERARSQAEYERPVRLDEALFVYFEFHSFSATLTPLPSFRPVGSQ
jgi:hypothetical protein